jgi:hypothetical protein
VTERKPGQQVAGLPDARKALLAGNQRPARVAFPAVPCGVGELDTDGVGVVVDPVRCCGGSAREDGEDRAVAMAVISPGRLGDMQEPIRIATMRAIWRGCRVPGRL